MRKEFDSSADKSSHPGFANAILRIQRCHPQIEQFRRVELPRRQPLFGLVKTEGIAQLAFAEFALPVTIINEAIALDNGFDRKGLLMPVFNRVTRPEPD